MSTVPGVVGGVSVPSSATPVPPTPAPASVFPWKKIAAEAMVAVDRAVIAGLSVLAGTNIADSSTNWKITGISVGVAAAGSLLVSLRNLLPQSPVV